MVKSVKNIHFFINSFLACKWFLIFDGKMDFSEKRNCKLGGQGRSFCNFWWVRDVNINDKFEISEHFSDNILPRVG